MSDRKVVYTLQINSNVRQVLRQSEQDALKFEGVISNLNNTLRSFGLGFLGANIFGGIKDGIHDFATLEQSMLRIKNASSDFSAGVRNQLFIRKEVDKFKIDLQESADAYGQFLLKIKNAGLGEDAINRMHDNILTISKVAGLSTAKMNATVNDIGIMLGEGVLEARHLRALGYVHPQIMPYVADELGLKDTKEKTKEQELYHSLSSGELTKSAIDAKVLVDALEKYRRDVEVGLPEALQLTESSLNELGTEWLKFKEGLGTELKPDIINFLHTTIDFIKWLEEHNDGIIRFGTAILHIAEAVIAYKVAMFAANGISAVFGMNTAKQIVDSTRLGVATSQETLAIRELTIALQALAVTQEEVAMTTELMINAQTSSMGVGYMAMGQAQRANLAASTAMMGSSSYGGAIGAGISGAAKAAMPVFIMGMAAQVALDLWGPKGQKDFGSKSPGVLDWAFSPFSTSRTLAAEDAAHKRAQHGFNQIPRYTDTSSDSWYNPLSPKQENKLDPKGRDLFEQLAKASVETSKFFAKKENLNGFDGNKNMDPKLLDAIAPLNEFGIRQNQTNEQLAPILKKLGYEIPDLKSMDSPFLNPENAGGAGNGIGHKLGKGLDGTNKIRGNSITNINLEIHEINGINKSTFSVKNEQDLTKIKDVVGVELTRRITQAINDSQIVAHR